jgi:uncharacterized protein (TIGR03435 family)
MNGRLIRSQAGLSIALVLAGAFASSLRAQQIPVGQSGPSFEVASIRESAPDSRTRVEPRPGRFSAIGVTLRDLIKMAYPAGVNVRNDGQVVTGDAWMGRVRFDVIATGAPATAATRPAPGAVAPPESALLDELRAKLRALLAERFDLGVHHESRQVPIYALTRVRADAYGPRLRAADAACTGGGTAAPPPGTDVPACGGFRLAAGRLRARAVTVPMLVSLLSNLPTVGRPVEDHTDLTGSFDMELSWAPDTAQTPDAADPASSGGPSLFTAMREQLGLELRPVRGAVDVVVVDRARLPSPN